MIKGTDSPIIHSTRPKLEPPFYLPSKVRIRFHPRTINKFLSVIKYFLVLIPRNLIIASPDVNKNKGVAEAAMSGAKLCEEMNF